MFEQLDLESGGVVIFRSDVKEDLGDLFFLINEGVQEFPSCYFRE